MGLSAFAGTADLPKAFVGEGFSRTGFEVVLELASAAFIFKRKIGDKFPGLELGSMNRRALVVLRKTIFQIAGKPNISLVSILQAAEKIDIVHRTPVLLRFYRSFGGQPTLLRSQIFAGVSQPKLRSSEGWLGRKDSNLRMPESKSGALPLGYAPRCVA